MVVEPTIFIKGTINHLFSRGFLAKKLELIGFSISEGYQFSNQIYTDLLRLEKKKLSKSYFDKFVYNHLKKKYNENIAEKYIFIENWYDTGIPLWILITGAKGVGKSTLSRQIASDLGIQHIIETDVVRDVLRKVLSAEVTPELHASSYNAYKKLRPIYSSRFDEVIIGFENHAKFVNMGVDAVLSRAEIESVSIVVEGEHLLPAFFDEIIRKKTNVIFITLALSDSAQHLEYLNSQYTQEKEDLIKHFEEIRKVHDHIVNETKIRKLPIVELESSQKPLQQVRKLIVDKIVSIVSTK